MAGGDGPQGVAKSDVLRQRRFGEVGRLGAPIVVGHGRDSGARERVGQDTGGHRTVDDDAGAVVNTPGDQIGSGLARQERERRLQRIDVANALAPLQQGHVVVADADRPHLSLVHEPAHLGPRILRRSSRLVGPVDLVQVDALDSKPPQRRLALAPQRGRLSDAPGRDHRVVRVPGQAAFGEDEGPIVRRDHRQGLAHDLLGVAQPVDGGRVDPVHSTLDGANDRPDGVGVILGPPAVDPTASADRP